MRRVRWCRIEAVREGMGDAMSKRKARPRWHIFKLGVGKRAHGSCCGCGGGFKFFITAAIFNLCEQPQKPGRLRVEYWLGYRAKEFSGLPRGEPGEAAGGGTGPPCLVRVCHRRSISEGPHLDGTPRAAPHRIALPQALGKRSRSLWVGVKG